MQPNTIKAALGRYFQRLAETNYYLAREHYLFIKGREQKCYPQPPLLIYQMGKVGSSTIVRSLKALNLGRPVYHTHLLTWPRISETESQRKRLFRTDRYSHLKRPWLNRFIRRQIDRGLGSQKWKVVSLVREPIARNISTFFENLQVEAIEENEVYKIGSDYYGFDPLTVRIEAVDKLIDLYFQLFRHDTPLIFFDQEFKEVLNFDVFQHPFRPAKGYEIYQGEPFSVMVMRLEDLNRIAAKAFDAFLGLKKFKLANANVGKRKVYAPLYKKFKQEIVFPKTYLDRFYQSRFMRHFYSGEEISTLRSMWNSQEQNNRLP